MMKNKLLFIVILLIYCIASVYSENRQIEAISNAEIENQSIKIHRIDSIQKIIISDINKHQRLNDESNDKIKEEVRNLFADANAIVVHREKSVDWWLTSIAIIIAAFTIIFSLITFFIGRKFYKDINDEKEKLNTEVQQFRKDFRILKSTTLKEAREMNKEAKFIIEELKSYRTDAQKIKNDIDGLGKPIEKANDNSDPLEKQKAKDIAKSIAHNRDATSFQRQLANAYDSYYSDDFPEAIEKYLELLKNNKNEMTVSQLGSIYFYLGYSYLSIEKYIEAIDFLQKSLEIFQNNYDINCHIGFCYQSLYTNDKDKKLLEKSMLYYKKAMDINPSNDDDWLYSKIAEVYCTLGDYDSAIDWYNKAISINKNDRSLLSCRIECLIFKNNIEKAKEKIREYRSIFHMASFDILYNSFLIEIIEGTDKDVAEIFNELKASAGTKIATTDWDFIDLNFWLESSASDFVTQGAKKKLKDLNTLFQEWENEEFQNK